MQFNYINLKFRLNIFDVYFACDDWKACTFEDSTNCKK